LPSSPCWDKELNFGVPISTRGVKVEPLSKRCFQNQNPSEREREREGGEELAAPNPTTK